jgi:predicted SprT family Zn-dependent metalloprotease
MAAKCKHKSNKLLEKKVTNVEEVPCAYAATVTNTTYQMLYECKDCGEKWTETKEESKLN